jgi:hypothetical protein
MQRSTAEPCPIWSRGTFAINVLPLKAKIKHGVTTSPTSHDPLEFEITFCVRGVLSPLLANVLLDEVDKELERRGHCFVRYADDGVPRAQRVELGSMCATA